MIAREERIGKAVSLFFLFPPCDKACRHFVLISFHVCRRFVLISFHVCRRFSSVGTISLSEPAAASSVEENNPEIG